MYNMAPAMKKVHIGIKNGIVVFPFSFLTLKMEKIGENVTGSVSKKVCADCSCFNSTKTKETTSPLHSTQGRGQRLHSVLTSSLAFLVRFSVVLFFGLAGRFQNRLNKNVRSSQGTKRSKFLKKAQVFVIDDSSSCNKLLQLFKVCFQNELHWYRL